MKLGEEKISSEQIYSGKIMKITKDIVRLSDGNESVREVVHHSGGVCVVPVDGDFIYLVRQYRYPLGGAILEIPAGKLEAGESHYDCGLRELSEEIGAGPTDINEYKYLGEVYPTPAYDTEIIHIYMVRGLKFSEQKLDDGEFLEVVKMPFDEAAALVMSGEIKDAKTQIGILKANLVLGA